MVTSLNTSRTARDLGYQQVHYIRGQVTFATTAAQVVGVLPANAIVVSGEARVTTAFNAGTTNTLDIGYAADTLSAADPDAYATLLALTVGQKLLDELGTATAAPRNIDTTVTATYVQTGTAATAGVAEVIIAFVLSK